jgi:hypothetical protein
MSPGKLLVVEGKNDEHVLYALLKHHHLTRDYEVKPEGGYKTLIKQLPARLKIGSGLNRLGVIVDADTSIQSRWQSIKAIVENAGYSTVPDEPDPEGTVIDDEFLPRLGFWIMPNNRLPGMLEDYIAYLVPQGDPLFDRAGRVLDDIPADMRLFSSAKRPKALIHTWLAWQEEPGKPLGQAVTAFMVKDVPSVGALLSWLTRVFA